MTEHWDWSTDPTTKDHCHESLRSPRTPRSAARLVGLRDVSRELLRDPRRALPLILRTSCQEATSKIENEFADQHLPTDLLLSSLSAFVDWIITCCPQQENALACISTAIWFICDGWGRWSANIELLLVSTSLSSGDGHPEHSDGHCLRMTGLDRDFVRMTGLDRAMFCMQRKHSQTFPLHSVWQRSQPLWLAAFVGFLHPYTTWYLGLGVVFVKPSQCNLKARCLYKIYVILVTSPANATNMFSLDPNRIENKCKNLFEEIVRHSIDFFRFMKQIEI